MHGNTRRRRWTYALAATLGAALLLGAPVYGAEDEEDRPYPLPDPDPVPLQAKGIILEFDVWPPDAEESEPLVRKLRNAGLNPVAALPLFKSWVFAWDELRESDSAVFMCFELALDDQVSSLFASCTPDTALSLPGPVDE